jgi:hypothetical protein
MSIFKNTDVQDKRRWQELKDQHGRTWGCVIELKTGDPTGPIEMREPRKAPLRVPPQFLRVDSRKNFGAITIDYHGWKGMLSRAWERWRGELLQAARKMYGDSAAEKVENPPPALVAEVGVSPEPLEPVLAAEHGDPWVLGLSDVRPPWANLFFPVRPKRAEGALPDELAFLNHGKQPEEEPEAEPDVEYPVMYAPGRWRLSNGTTVQGKKVDAQKAENALLATHESWAD